MLKIPCSCRIGVLDYFWILSFNFIGHWVNAHFYKKLAEKKRTGVTSLADGGILSVTSSMRYHKGHWMRVYHWYEQSELISWRMAGQCHEDHTVNSMFYKGKEFMYWVEFKQTKPNSKNPTLWACVQNKQANRKIKSFTIRSWDHMTGLILAVITVNAEPLEAKCMQLQNMQTELSI